MRRSVCTLRRADACKRFGFHFLAQERPINLGLFEGKVR